jgi:hypothetical protein
MKNRLLNLLWAGLVATFLFSGLCFAQAGSASVTGLVTDPQGARVPNAKVIARKVDTGIERITQSTSDGLYRFDALEPGIYDFRVEQQGFNTAEAKAVKLQVGEQRDVNFTLGVSGTAEKVTITAAAPLVETTKTDVSSVIDDKDVATLPTTTAFNSVGGISNDYAGLATLAPGVKYDLSNNSSDLIAPGSVNNRGVQVNLDGGNISDQVVSTRDALGASVEEVKEFQVLTNNYNAEYGQAGGVILNVITKSGANDFHGDVHTYFRGRNLTASTFLYNDETDDSDFRRAPFQKQEGGLTAGGPIIKDKTFWFFSYEQAHQEVPLTLTPPSGFVTVGQPVFEVLGSFKVDHQINANNKLSVRYNLQRDTSGNVLVQVVQATPNSLVNEIGHDNTLNISETMTPTSHTVNEARFFWHRFLSQTPDLSSEPGIQFPNVYTGAAFCCPQGALQNRYQWIDNFSWTHGDHTVKTGLNISHFPYLSLFQQFHFGEYITDANLQPTSFTIGAGSGTVNASDNIYGLYVQDTWKVKPSLTINYGLRYDLEVGAFKGGTIPTAGGGCLQSNGLIPACSSDHNNFQPRLGIAWSPRFESGLLHSIFGDPNKSVIRASFAEVTELAFLNVVLDSLNFDGRTLLTETITNPSVLKFFPNEPPQSALAPFISGNITNFGRVRPIADNLHNPETRNANLTISRQFGSSFVLEAGYIGVFGFGLFGEQDTNYPAVLPDPAHPGYFYMGNRPDSSFGAIRTNENSRTSHYNGFTLHAIKRLSHHLQFQAGYTLSKALADTEDFYGTSEPGNPFNIKADMALADIDTRNQVNFGVVYDTIGATERPVLRSVVNNWTIGLIGQLQSGRPYPISTGDGPYATDTFPGIGAETQQRPNVGPGGVLTTTNLAGNAGANLLVGPGGASLCNCPQTTFNAPKGASPLGPVDSILNSQGMQVPVDFQFLNGDLARNMGHGAPYYRLDMSFIKSFRIVPSHEQMRLEFKADVFNILNHTNFLLFNGDDVLSTFRLGVDGTGRGQANCTSCLNVFTGHYIGSNGQTLTVQDLEHGNVSPDIQNPIFAGLGDPSGVDLARTVQLSVRFRW